MPFCRIAEDSIESIVGADDRVAEAFLILTMVGQYNRFAAEAQSCTEKIDALFSSFVIDISHAPVYLDRLAWRELKRDIDLREFGTDLMYFSPDRRFTSGEPTLRDQPVVDPFGGMFLLP